MQIKKSNVTNKHIYKNIKNKHACIIGNILFLYYFNDLLLNYWL